MTERAASGARRRRGHFIGTRATRDEITELHIEEDVMIAPDRTRAWVRYRSAVNPNDVRVFEYTDPKTVSALAQAEEEKAQLAAADAHRSTPVNSFFKERAEAMESRTYEHCDGFAVFDGEARADCGGTGKV